MMSWKMAGMTDTGRARSCNEDAVSWNVEQGWAVLADGMGGHRNGEQASGTAVEVVGTSLSGSTGTAALQEAVAQANSAIFEIAAQQPHTMGTTVVAVSLQGQAIHFAHVGDSRLYRLRGNELLQLTHDHSLVQELVDEGMMTSEQARSSEQKNIITRALGLEAEVEIELGEEPLQAGDSYLLCSDGLSNMLEDEGIAQRLVGESLPEVVSGLVDAANERGGSDNISVIVIRIWE